MFTGILCIFVFVADSSLRLGVAVPVLYIAVLWIASFRKQRSLMVTLITACVTLTILGYFLSDPGGASQETVIFNRLLYAGIICTNGLLLVRQIESEELLGRANELLEARVEERTKQLKDAHQQSLQDERLIAIGEVVAGMAHESRNALQRMQSSVNRLRRRLRIEEQVILESIQHACDDLQRLYEDIRLYASPMALDKSQDSLVGIWREVWGEVKELHAGRQMVLREELPAKLENLSIDSFRMKQVFRNIFENSVAAKADDVTIAISLSFEQGCCRITISDDGPGLSEEQQEKLFTAFFTTKQKGTGVGMALVQRTILAHGGDIRIVSPNPGLTLEIVLPV